MGLKENKMSEQPIEIKTIFPTSILNTNIGRDLNKHELASLLEHKREDNISKNIENSSSIERYILNKEPELKYLRLFIEEQINIYTKDVMMVSDDIEFYITQSWLNWTEKGESHHRHYHANSIISGVFYINALLGSDSIVFFLAGPQETLQLQRTGNNEFNELQHRHHVKTGDLVLFPSTLPHQVETVNTDETRSSLAFNVFVKGTLGSYVESNELFL
jgi:uncharacterized protein (TIGR02466 family)